MPQHAALLSVATAAPPYVLDQDAAARIAEQVYGERFPDFTRLIRVFQSAGIESRRAVRPIDWYLEPQGWPERTEAYLDSATALFATAARKALAQANVEAGEVDMIVTASSTGIATPSLEARAAAELGFRADAARTPVFGLGCAGGVSGLALAARLAEAEPGKTVLFVTVETCTLAFRPDAPTKANIVATALFGDGAASAVLRAGDGAGLAEVAGAGEHTWPDTLGIMGWDVDPEGFGVIFDRAIPPFAEENLGPAVDGILERLGTDRSEIARFVCHPGGAKVLTALEHALGLEAESLQDERAVLAAYGNMSAPTVLFVLERALEQGLPGKTAALALGPGFTASCVLLEPVQ